MLSQETRTRTKLVFTRRINVKTIFWESRNAYGVYIASGGLPFPAAPCVFEAYACDRDSLYYGEVGGKVFAAPALNEFRTLWSPWRWPSYCG